MTVMALRKCFSACFLFLLLAITSEAETIVLSSFADLVNIHASDYPEMGGMSVNYSANNVSFTNYNNGEPIFSNPRFSLVYTTYKYAEWPSFGTDVGGVDGIGTTATGWFNVATNDFAGIDIGENANSNDDVGYWTGFVDLNGNGIYGTYEQLPPGGGILSIEPGESIVSINVSDFQPLQIGSGTLSAGSISGVHIMPDLSTASIRLDGVAVSIGQGNSFSFAVCTTNLPFFRVEWNDSLANATWTSMAQYNVTGAVTCVTGTNAVPQRFYRVVAP